nr:unnamed protein product [Digitaria exilis]
MADRTTTGRSSGNARMRPATSSILAADDTEDPPNFMTTLPRSADPPIQPRGLQERDPRGRRPRRPLPWPDVGWIRWPPLTILGYWEARPRTCPALAGSLGRTRRRGRHFLELLHCICMPGEVGEWRTGDCRERDNYHTYVVDDG